MDFLAILSGFGIGAIVGMTGVGGGSLMTPLLIGVFRLSPAVAIAASCSGDASCWRSVVTTGLVN